MKKKIAMFIASWWLIAPAATYWYYEAGCWLTGWNGFCDTVSYLDLMGGKGVPIIVGG